MRNNVIMVIDIWIKLSYSLRLYIDKQIQWSMSQTPVANKVVGDVRVVRKRCEVAIVDDQKQFIVPRVDGRCTVDRLSTKHQGRSARQHCSTRIGRLWRNMRATNNGFLKSVKTEIKAIYRKSHIQTKYRRNKLQ